MYQQHNNARSKFTYTRFFSLLFFPALFSCSEPMGETITHSGAGNNLGFEYAENSIPFNWMINTVKTTGNGAFTIATDSSQSKEGKQSLKFLVKACSGKSGKFAPGIAQEIAVDAGEKYRVGFWAKNKGTEYELNIKAVNVFGRGVRVRMQQFGSGDWQKQECEISIPKDMHHIRFELAIIKPGTLWVDGIVLEKI